MNTALSGRERCTLATVGGVLIVVGMLLWIFPAKHQKPAPESAKCTDAKTCFVEVEDAPELLLSSFVVLGALLIVVGVNGRRLTKFSAPGVSFESEGAKAAAEAADKLAKDPNLNDAQKGVGTTLAAEKARSAAMAHAALAQAPLSTEDLDRISTDAVDAVKAQL